MAGLVVAGLVTDDVPDGAGRAGPTRRRLPPLSTTPGKVRASLAGIVLFTCGLGVLIAVVFGSVAGGFTAIGNVDAPLAEQSGGLYFSVTDMDAQVANVLLTGDDPLLAVDRQQDLRGYARDRERAEQDLQQVAVTAAADPAAQRAVSSVLDALGRYEAMAAEAILVNQRGSDRAGRPSAATLNYYRPATDLMRTGILPAAASLTAANANSLDAAYRQSRSAALDGRLIVLLTGLAVVGALTGLQVYFALRYRRMVNPALAAATLLAGVLVIVSAVQLGAQADHLKVAKQDAFDSILALTQARAISYDANADESRYLVDPGRDEQYQDSFLSKSRQLADVGKAGISGYDAALGTGIAAYQADSADVPFGGYLGQEFRNITFPGERAAATKALLAYQVYERDDRRLRTMAATNLDQAIAFDVSTSPGQSDWAFGNWDTALTAVITINENAFTAAVRDGARTGNGWTGVIPAVSVAAIAGLAAWGTRRRLTEYR